MRVPLVAALAATLLAAGACSPSASPPDRTEEARSEAAADPPAITAVAAPGPSAEPPLPSGTAEAQGVRRCGWLSNPTPANWWLTDAEDQWVLGTQGAYQAPGMDEMPDMSTAGWVEINGHYGYGCACMTIASNPDGRVTRVSDAEPKPLAQCRADRKLPKPE